MSGDDRFGFVQTKVERKLCCDKKNLQSSDPLTIEEENISGEFLLYKVAGK